MPGSAASSNNVQRPLARVHATDRQQYACERERRPQQLNEQGGVRGRACAAPDARAASSSRSRRSPSASAAAAAAALRASAASVPRCSTWRARMLLEESVAAGAGRW